MHEEHHTTMEVLVRVSEPHCSSAMRSQHYYFRNIAARRSLLSGLI